MFIVVFVVSLYTFKCSIHESNHVHLKEFPSIYVKKILLCPVKDKHSLQMCNLRKKSCNTQRSIGYSLQLKRKLSICSQIKTGTWQSDCGSTVSACTSDETFILCLSFFLGQIWSSVF